MPTLPWNIDLTPEQTGLSLDVSHDFETGETVLSVTNTGETTLRPSHLTFTSPLPLKAAGASFWLHGRAAADDTLIRVLGEPEEDGYRGTHRETLDGAVRYRSREVVVLSVPAQGQPSLVIGCIEPGRFFFDITVETSANEFEIHELGMVFNLESSVEIAPGETLMLPALHVREGGEPLSLIEGFADAAATKMGARVPSTPPTGLRLNSRAESLGAANPFGSYVIVPAVEGYAEEIARIKEAGFAAGLYFAPLTFREDEDVVTTHPELLLKTPSGDVFFADSPTGRVVALDCTNPASAEWLATSIRALIERDGVTFLELTTVGAAAASAEEVVYHEPGTTGPANLRRGLQVVRKAAGEDVILLAGDCPFGPAIGLVDAMRTSEETSGDWASVRQAMRLALQRNWMNGRWWANDAADLTAGLPGERLSAAEMRFLATGLALSGGVTFAFDDIAALGPWWRELAMSLTPSTGIAGRPDDPFEGPVPSTWRATLDDGRTLVGILNWTEQTAWVSQNQFLPPGEVAFDTWNGDLAGMGDVRIDPHDARLFQVSQARREARVSGDTGHIAMAGLAQREVSARVQARNDRDYPRTIAITARRKTTVYTLKPGEYRWFD